MRLGKFTCVYQHIYTRAQGLKDANSSTAVHPRLRVRGCFGGQSMYARAHGQQLWD